MSEQFEETRHEASERPRVGQRVYYVDNRESQGGVLDASISQVFPDGSIALLVLDPNAPQGRFDVSPVVHDENRAPGTYHFPK